MEALLIFQFVNCSVYCFSRGEVLDTLQFCNVRVAFIYCANMFILEYICTSTIVQLLLPRPSVCNHLFISVYSICGVHPKSSAPRYTITAVAVHAQTAENVINILRTVVEFFPTTCTLPYCLCFFTQFHKPWSSPRDIFEI